MADESKPSAVGAIDLDEIAELTDGGRRSRRVK
jgi:hypothetical protein